MTSTARPERLPVSTAIHFHGVVLPIDPDGVPRRPRRIEMVGVDHVTILNDGLHGYTINGRGFPAPEPVMTKLGQKVRLCLTNEGMTIHAMHLHGMPMAVIDEDGRSQPAPWRCGTLDVAPGDRWDAVVDCADPGVWAVDCRILAHADAEHGMFGMVTARIVER